MMNASVKSEERLTATEAPAVGGEERPLPVGRSVPKFTGREPVFVGTRVLLNAMFDYLEGNHSVDDFLRDFPTGDRAAALHIARWAVLMASARSHR